ncbi:MAG: nitroreductase [Bacteroidales bacterium]|nr:nitroreductase [Bacteroidales bacterium]
MESLTFIELAKLLISFAVLAPSGHNSQPWLFQVGDNEIIISPDYAKRLDVVDSENRELFISLGCAVQNLMTAAHHYGYDATYEYNNGKIVVKISKQEVKKDDPLFDAIKKRHTHRGNFTGAIIPENLLQGVDNEDNASVLIYKSESPEAEIIRQKIVAGNEIQMSDTAFKRELVSWMRFNKKHVNETRNGLCYNVLGFPATPKPIGRKIVGMFLNPKAQNKTDVAVNASASHFCVFCVKENTPQNWIDLGVFLERFLLKITSQGIAYNFSNQPCEIPSLNQELQKELNITHCPSVVVRLGYGKEPKHFAPREEVKL